MAGKPTAELRLVLLGRSGVGKSSAGNTLLGRAAFAAGDSQRSVTLRCEKQVAAVSGRSLCVTDCPGLLDSCDSLLTLRLDSFCPGFHAFLLVLRLGVKLTEEEKNAVEWIKEKFGEDAVKYTVVLFTCGDALKGRPVEEYISKSKDLQKIIYSCYGRYHTFNNEDRAQGDQVLHLLEMIQRMVMFNGGSPYTSAAAR